MTQKIRDKMCKIKSYGVADDEWDMDTQLRQTDLAWLKTTIEKLCDVVDASEELQDLMQGVIDTSYTPDSFTLQPMEVEMQALKEWEDQ